MGVRELREAFNEVSGQTANCVKAFMDYKTLGGIQYQILIFSGNYADGAGWVIQSEPIRPSGDLAQAARATAESLLQRVR